MSKETPGGKLVDAARGASVLSALITTAQTRRRELKTRIIIALAGAFILWSAVNPVWAMAWFIAVCVSQAIDLHIWRPFTDSARKTPPTPREWFLVCASAAQATFFYSLFPTMLWFTWGTAGKVFAILWISGALLHITLHMHHERRTFWSAMAPHGVYYFGLPLLALISGEDPGRAGALAILLAQMLYVSHLALAFRAYSDSSASMRLAREKAQSRQHAAEQANMAKSTFLANMSHEIRTPMNGILGMAAALEDSRLTKDQQEKLKIISDSGDHLMMVLNDLLDFSKIEANKIELEHAPFSFADLARRVQSLHSFKAREMDLDFEVTCEGESDAMRLGDGHRLLQVLHNLVSNAIKFTDEGAVHVRIGIDPEDASCAKIEVKDSGIGMSDDQIARIFDPFTQADVTTTRKYGGTGLGLSIAKSLVAAMDGRIDVRSALGAGTVFTVTFPAPLADASDLNADAHADALYPQCEGLRVLVGEDNVVNQAVIRAFLDQRNHDVTIVTDGLEVVAAYKSGVYDVVLMDISMPRLDGPEAMRQIRFLEREMTDRQPTPIVGVSAHAMRQEVDEFLEMGFDGYVTKPIRAETLHLEIDRVVAAKSDDNQASAVA
ncbi:MAG: ATP-binding protein [Pseudomonadota bacterium]